MSKKGHTNNPAGRPLKNPEDKFVTPARQLGRVSDEDWNALQLAAGRSGESFTRWAMAILLRAAKRSGS